MRTTDNKQQTTKNLLERSDINHIKQTPNTEHHRKKTFKEEYLALLKAFEIEFKDDYLFKWITE